MSVAIKTCPTCGQVNPGTSGFCPGCGASLAGVAPTVKSWTATQSSFAIPAYLHRDYRKRRRHPVPGTGGGGLAWVGFFLVAIPILTSADSTLATATWGVGILAIIAGFWRMRHDGGAMGRVGLVTNLIAVATLGGIGFQLGTTNDGGHGATFGAASPTTPPDWLTAAPTVSPAAPGSPGTVAMFRGLPAHTGLNPGPGPIGHPDLRWRLDTAGEVYSSPAVDGGLVFLGNKSGFLIAIDAATGQRRWQIDLGSYIVYASPAVVDRTVFVETGYTLYALDAMTGKEQWRFAIRLAGKSSPTVVGGVVYVGSQDLVYAVDAVTGKEKWHFQTEGLLFSSPAVESGTVFIGSDDGTLYALDAASGQSRWKFATGGEVYASPAVVADTVFVSSKSHSVFAVDIKTGKQRWRYSIGGDSSPAVANGVVFVGGDDGGLYALDAASGAPQWLFATGAPIASSPVIAGNTVYVASGLTIYAVDAATGKASWHYATTDTIETSPAVVDGVVYIGSRDGYLYAIGGDGQR